LLTYDYFPKKAICQALGNGNVKIYAGITEGYPRYPVNELDVTMTVANVKNTGVDLGLPNLTYIYQPSTTAFVFTVTGTSKRWGKILCGCVCVRGWLYDTL